MCNSKLTENKKEELERKYQKEITDYQNKIICKAKFIYLIKKCNFMEFCYLYQTYIGHTKPVRQIPEIISEGNVFIEEIDITNYTHDRRINKKTYSNKNIKKLARIESMSKNRHYK